MSHFLVGLTNDSPSTKPPVYKQYHHVQYDKDLPPSATGSVSFPPSGKKYRYLIIQKKFDHNQAICIAEVKVYVRGIHAFRIAI